MILVDHLKNEYVTLKVMTLEDAPALHKMMSDSVLCDKAGLLEHTHISQTQDFILEGLFSMKHKHEILLGIFNPDELVGIINIFNIDHHAKSGEYGYFISSNHTRMGYMEESLKLLSNTLIDAEIFKELNVYVELSNRASLRLAQKLNLSEMDVSVEEDMRNRSVEMKRFVINKRIG